MESLPTDLKHLYITWLDEETDKYSHRQEKSSMILSKASRAVRDHPNPVQVPEDLIKLKGIGEWVVGKLRKKLEFYCNENGYEIPPAPEKVTRTGSKKRATSDDTAATTQAKKKRAYVPKKRSGAYAIVLVLLEFDSEMRGLTKDTICQNAAPYCDSSFSANPSTQQFYSAWSSVKKLIMEGLVCEQGRPVRYYLTDEGMELAKKIKNLDDITFRNEAPPPEQRERSTSQASAPVMTDSLRDEPRLEVRIPKDRVEEELNGVRYFFWAPGTFDVKFIIDNREIRSAQERDFFGSKLQQLGVDTSKKALTLGDGLWIARNKQTNEEVVLNYILERKRLDDLSSSIQDGRYTEQKARLKRTGIDNVFYLVEEVTSSDISHMSQGIQTSISLALAVSNFHVERTKDADGTVHFISKLTQQIRKFYSKKSLLVINPSNMQTQMDYKATLDAFRQQFKNDKVECCHQYSTFDAIMSKTSMMTTREIFVRMLMTVRGISLEKAISIQKEYPTPTIMFETFNPKDPTFQSKYGKKIAETLGKVFGCI